MIEFNIWGLGIGDWAQSPFIKYKITFLKGLKY